MGHPAFVRVFIPEDAPPHVLFWEMCFYAMVDHDREDIRRAMELSPRIRFMCGFLDWFEDKMYRVTGCRDRVAYGCLAIKQGLYQEDPRLRAAGFTIRFVRGNERVL